MRVQLRRRRWAVTVAASGTVLIAGGAFWLSFVSLADLARRSGITVGQAWIWPLLVDGLIVVATVAVVALDGHRAAWYPWALLVLGALVSVAANAIHAVVAADTTMPALLAALVAAVPPVVLLAATHLTVVLIRSTHPAPDGLTEPSEALPTLASPSTDPWPPSETPVRPALLAPADVPPPAPPAGPENEPSAEEPPAPDEPDEPVDRRERAARLRAAGWSNKQIARELDVHPSTVGRWLPRPEPAADPSGSASSSGPAEAGSLPVLTEEVPS